MGQSDSRERQYEGRVRLEQRLAELRQEMHGAQIGMEDARRAGLRERYAMFARTYAEAIGREKEVNAALALIRKTFMGIESASIVNETLAIQESAIGQAEKLTGKAESTVKKTLKGRKVFDKLSDIATAARDASADLASATHETAESLRDSDETAEEHETTEEDRIVQDLMKSFDRSKALDDAPRVPTDAVSVSGDLEDRLAQLREQP